MDCVDSSWLNLIFIVNMCIYEEVLTLNTISHKEKGLSSRMCTNFYKTHNYCTMVSGREMPGIDILIIGRTDDPYVTVIFYGYYARLL